MGEKNEEVWELWQFVQGQWRMSFGGPIALDYGVIFQIAPILEIEITRPLLLKIKALERESLRKINEKDSTAKKN